jgi:hypothetical protein
MEAFDGKASQIVTLFHPSVPVQSLRLFYLGLGQLLRHCSVGRVPVEVLKHLDRCAHVASEGVVVDALMQSKRRIGMAERIDRPLLSVPVNINPGFFDQCLKPLFEGMDGIPSL